MEKTVLITGVSGFAGHYLAPQLAKNGYHVVGTGRTNLAQCAGVHRLVAVDLKDAEQVKVLAADVRPSHVVHLAALSFVGHQDAADIYATNVVGTRNLLAALSALETRPQSVLLTSSATVYGSTGRETLSEDDAFHPANDYGVSKVAMEFMARQFSETLNMVVARPFNYSGKGQSPNFLIPKIVDHFRARAPFIELGNTDVSRDFSDVRDVAGYMHRLLEAPQAQGDVFNICSGVATSLQEVIDLCQELTGHKIEVRVNKAFQRANEVKVSVGNPEKLQSAVGRVRDHDVRDMLSWMLSD